MARILIVEDDRPFADALAVTLQLEGHNVLVASDAHEGIQIGLAERPDAVIADWMLKCSIHGGEVCRRIRAACPQVKTILITGCMEVVDQAERWSECAEAIIEKPFHKGRILEAVDEALSGGAELTAGTLPNA